NLFRLSARERLFCMIAATGADLDGVTFLFGQTAYQTWHHVLGHNIFLVVIMTSLLTIFSQHRWKALPLYFALAHLHLVMDYYGSGPDWPIYYLWPISSLRIRNYAAWPFLSWQNIIALIVFLVWTVVIARQNCRTPFELIAPEVDHRILGWLGRPARLQPQPSQS
ncbi:MAG TPA: metal-dependent hydrolase, partial [Tepidisphaeraceae bacterium]|nr:metal-dependent hydrolase [Tepidisphaeraceae bacterium]